MDVKRRERRADSRVWTETLHYTCCSISGLNNCKEARRAGDPQLPINVTSRQRLFFQGFRAVWKSRWPSLTVLMVSMDVKRDWTWTSKASMLFESVVVYIVSLMNVFRPSRSAGTNLLTIHYDGLQQFCHFAVTFLLRKSCFNNFAILLLQFFCVKVATKTILVKKTSWPKMKYT